MRYPTWLAAALLFASAACGIVRAQLAEKGALLFEENFQGYASYTKERQPLRGGWQVRVAHGTWERTPDGVASRWTAGHSPVLVVEGNFGDVVIEVDFRYRAEPDRWAAFRVSAANPALDPRAYAVSVWANVNFDSRGRGLWLENDQWSGPITRVGYAKAQFAPDTWHTMRLEIVGNDALAACNGVTAKGSHSKFAVPKTSIWLGTGMSRHELRNLRVYAAKPVVTKATAASSSPLSGTRQ
jgi:hypothetical protein